MHGLVETLARAMCIAAGNDPDVMVVSTNHPLERLNGHGDWSLIPSGFNVIPAWRVWEPEARVAISRADMESAA